ncbi:MAG: hypothetical protein GFH27_549379n69 [Chloroflexi bacterium AL-W]|nr:hypothetical protein [Chloroflexi bacterium AL-N1]NOK71193.1 hypothetical protein [Chloroflexi bacterium AL-N10]NOK78659.1 hypothetical protein [Chloroflexi bacterium AL-N5]NOK85955.1 hypothetical protein [Chloroflexi bacterium AL-W]NOK92930.1 hypothetical protein [Chloroflexi bacterium AL-N15]
MNSNSETREIENYNYPLGQKVITYLDINLFESPAQTLVNTVNTVGVMGKGIALTFKQLYPEMFQRYRQICQEKQLEVGKLYVYRTRNKIVVNFPTKKHWRRPSQVDYIEAGLQNFVATYQNYGITSVSFPQLGCGNGELDWETQVQPLMESYLHTLPIPVYIHLYSKSPNFVPERLDHSFIRKLHVERERISTHQLWQDLINFTSSKTNSPYLMDIFTTVEITDEYMCFTATDQKAIIYQEDVEDLWNILRIRGTIRENEVSQQITDQHIAGTSTTVLLFNLLSRLRYIKNITLGTRKNGELVREQGLQYVPDPKAKVSIDNEITL